jgi:hypothetical protein
VYVGGWANDEPGWRNDCFSLEAIDRVGRVSAGAQYCLDSDEARQVSADGEGCTVVAPGSGRPPIARWLLVAGAMVLLRRRRTGVTRGARLP